MKTIITVVFVAMYLTACNNNQVSFSGIKVFDSQFNVALETDDKDTINKLEALFNDKTEFNEMAPDFKYLIELKTSGGTERWRYSRKGYIQKYSKEDQRIFALLDKDQFNKLAHIN